MRDLAVDYARDLRVVGICVSSVFTCCRFLRAGGFCLLPFFGYNTTIKKIHNYKFQKIICDIKKYISILYHSNSIIYKLNNSLITRVLD